MKIILLKTIPRSGATGLISSFGKTFESIPSSAVSAYIRDADALIGQGIKFQDEILESLPLADFVVLKTHQTYANLKNAFSQISYQQPVLVNLFRPPFDVAVSTYYYLTRKLSLIPHDKLSLHEFLQEWALKQGNDDIFINNGYPSYIQYAHHALRENENNPEKVVNFTYHEATNEREKTFSRIMETACEAEENELKKLLTSHFKNFDLQQAKDTLGHNFVHTGGSGYINDPGILSIITPEQVAAIKKLYEECFGDTLNRVNKYLMLNLTCY